MPSTVSGEVPEKATVLIVGNNCSEVNILVAVFKTVFQVLKTYTLDPGLVSAANVVIVVGDLYFAGEVKKFSAKFPLAYYIFYDEDKPDLQRDDITVVCIRGVTLSYFVQMIQRELVMRASKYKEGNNESIVPL